MSESRPQVSGTAGWMALPNSSGRRSLTCRVGQRDAERAVRAPSPDGTPLLPPLSAPACLWGSWRTEWLPEPEPPRSPHMGCFRTSRWGRPHRRARHFGDAGSRCLTPVRGRGKSDVALRASACDQGTHPGPSLTLTQTSAPPPRLDRSAGGRRPGPGRRCSVNQAIGRSVIGTGGARAGWCRLPGLRCIVVEQGDCSVHACAVECSAHTRGLTCSAPVPCPTLPQWQGRYTRWDGTSGRRRAHVTPR